MSIQFGRWNLDCKPVDRGYFHRAHDVLAKYASDAHFAYFDDELAILYNPWHATKEALRKRESYKNVSGIILTWDGRLDNREELIAQVTLDSESVPTDADIVVAAYVKWKTDCLPRLIGDWALVIWDAKTRSLIMAKDFLGTRQLFYRLTGQTLTWSTVLDPLVILEECPDEINEEFVAGYLSTFPDTQLAPFVGISAVPASAFVQINRSSVVTRAYWNFDLTNKIRYRTDADYEQHFTSLFAHAVRRRIRSCHPVLAELSGGIDSTSIVCVADGLIRTGDSDCPRLDTISYFDDDEPNWNERPYFSLIEKKRGRTGHHIDLTGAAGAFEEPNADFVYPLPGLDAREVSRSVHFGKIAQEGPHRVLLSGVGGDEFLGGVPNHIPEIQDLFVQFRWAEMAQALTHWSFYKRRPWIHLCSQALEEFLPQTIRRTYKDPRIAPWFNPKFAKRYADVFWRDMNRTTLLGVVPSIQSQINTVNHIRRQLSCSHAFPSDGCQVTYPYLDRDLLTFLFAIPRDQLIRAGQRRSLMRRALKGIVPSEILERKRKAFVARRPIVLLQTAEVAVGKLLDRPQVVERGWVELVPLLAALGRVRRGQIDNMVVLLETLKVELWLRTLTNRQLLRTNRRTDHDSILYATSSTS